jgi:hypothetical protein
MKKLRSDSKWHRLSQKQREEVLHWLFDEGLGYAQALRRARKQFGVKASISSIKRFYHHVCEERRAGELAMVQGTPEDFKAAAMKLLGLATFNVAVDIDPRREGVQRLKPLVKLMLKDSQQKLDRDKLALACARLAAQSKKAK